MVQIDCYEWTIHQFIVVKSIYLNFNYYIYVSPVTTPLLTEEDGSGGTWVKVLSVKSDRIFQ